MFFQSAPPHVVLGAGGGGFVLSVTVTSEGISALALQLLRRSYGSLALLPSLYVTVYQGSQWDKGLQLNPPQYADSVLGSLDLIMI